MVSSRANDTDFITAALDPIDEPVEDVEVIERVQVVNRTFAIHDESVLVHFEVR